MELKRNNLWETQHKVKYIFLVFIHLFLLICSIFSPSPFLPHFHFHVWFVLSLLFIFNLYTLLLHDGQIMFVNILEVLKQTQEIFCKKMRKSMFNQPLQIRIWLPKTQKSKLERKENILHAALTLARLEIRKNKQDNMFNRFVFLRNNKNVYFAQYTWIVRWKGQANEKGTCYCIILWPDICEICKMSHLYKMAGWLAVNPLVDYGQD